MNKNVLLLGNGINNVSKQYSWEQLIEDLVSYVGVEQLDTKDKPFPLFYEEIYLSNLKRGKKIDEKSLKTFISDRIKKIKPNNIHREIISRGFSDIITTNYDINLECSRENSPDKFYNHGVVKENLYSLFRHSHINQTKVWHIHGELNSPKSILLGYEQYSGQLQLIRNYVVSGTGESYENIEFPPLFRLIQKNKVKGNSWLDLIFTENIHIIGLTLDFIESDLWWLLTFRARLILENKISLQNSITYYFPVDYKNKIKPKLELLSANEVIITPIEENPNNEAYYYKILNSL